MATIAKLRSARITPQKARLVADQIRGLPVDRAINILTFSNKKAAGLIKKVLHQRRQAIQALAQRRDMQAEHVEAVIQILTELALGA